VVDYEKVQREYLNSLDDSVVAKTQEMFLQVAGWLVRMEDHTGQRAEQSVAERISRLSQMIIQGVTYAYNLANFVKT
jgi:hypothetical protein